VTIQYNHTAGETEPAIKFFRRQADRLRSLTKVVISPDKTVIHDINRGTMEYTGLTFGDPALEALLKELGVVYEAEGLKRAAAEGREVEYPLSARFPWGWERVSG
jgi:hypothetical protein